MVVNDPLDDARSPEALRLYLDERPLPWYVEMDTRKISEMAIVDRTATTAVRFDNPQIMMLWREIGKSTELVL